MVMQLVVVKMEAMILAMMMYDGDDEAKYEAGDDEAGDGDAGGDEAGDDEAKAT